MYKGFIFDLNGTMVNDMHYHTAAWHGIFNGELGKDITIDAVKKEMYGKNQEVIERVFGKGHFPDDEITTLSLNKEKRYQQEFLPHLALISGLSSFLQKADEHKILMAIASAAITSNIDFVIDNLHIRHYFPAIVSADMVILSKPHPETFLMAAEKLGLTATDCVVFEDAPKGVEAAANAGMKSVVITTMHEKEEFAYLDNILFFIEDYTDAALGKLFV